MTLFWTCRLGGGIALLREMRLSPFPSPFPSVAFPGKKSEGGVTVPVFPGTVSSVPLSPFNIGVSPSHFLELSGTTVSVGARLGQRFNAQVNFDLGHVGDCQ